jgi:hypothetical protein
VIKKRKKTPRLQNEIAQPHCKESWHSRRKVGEYACRNLLDKSRKMSVMRMNEQWK